MLAVSTAVTASSSRPAGSQMLPRPSIDAVHDGVSGGRKRTGPVTTD
jgi:hypothetical protein